MLVIALKGLSALYNIIAIVVKTNGTNNETEKNGNYNFQVHVHVWHLTHPYYCLMLPIYMVCK